MFQVIEYFMRNVPIRVVPESILPEALLLLLLLCHPAVDLLEVKGIESRQLFGSLILRLLYLHKAWVRGHRGGGEPRTVLARASSTEATSDPQEDEGLRGI
jgi:hypothetical protein